MPCISIIFYREVGLSLAVFQIENSFLIVVFVVGSVLAETLTVLADR